MIFKVNNFIIVFLFLFLISCGKEKQEISKITETNIQLQMIEAYQDGLEALEDGDVILASKKLGIVRSII